MKAARAWLAETNGEDARGCVSWRRAIVLAGQHVKEAGEAITDAAARAEREALAAPIIEEAQNRLVTQETLWRKQLADAGREPSARGYAGLISMFEDSTRRWCEWFDGYTDYDGVAHAGHGDPSLSFVAQYDAWANSKRSSRSVYYPSRYTSASLIAGGRVDAAGVAFTLAVVDRIEGRGAEGLRQAAATVQKNPQGSGAGSERKHLASWAKYPHNSFGEPTRLAEHAVAEWAALETVQGAYNGVRDFEKALHWDAHYAGERAEARSGADRAGLAECDEALAERAASGQTAAAWEAAVERLMTARARVYAAAILVAGDLERARACGERVRKGDALAEEVWSAVRSCEEAYDNVLRAKRDAAHYEETAEVYRAAGALSDFVAECERMEDAAACAEPAREETLNLYASAFEDSATAVEDRRGLQESTASDRPVPDEVTADLEPGDQVAVSNREVGVDEAATTIEEKDAMPHSVTKPRQPARMFGYVQTARRSADLQRAEIVKTIGAIRIFSDEGVSGTTAGTDRPGLRELVAELEAGDEVVVWRYDRLGRAPEALRVAVALVNATGATLRSLTEPPAEALFPMMFTMAADGYEHGRSPARRGGKSPSGSKTLAG